MTLCWTLFQLQVSRMGRVPGTRALDGLVQRAISVGLNRAVLMALMTMAASPLSMRLLWPNPQVFMSIRGWISQQPRMLRSSACWILNNPHPRLPPDLDNPHLRHPLPVGSGGRGGHAAGAGAGRGGGQGHGHAARARGRRQGQGDHLDE